MSFWFITLCLALLSGIMFDRVVLAVAQRASPGAVKKLQNLPGIGSLITVAIAPGLKAGALKNERDIAYQRYQTLTENLAASVIVRDPAGKIVYASPYTEVLTGYSIRQLSEQATDFLALVHEGDREIVQRSLKIAAQGEAFQYRYRMTHQSGIELWVETRAVPINDDNGELLGSLAITFDITGMMRSQQQVEERNRDLQEFTYMVSHDLKAPLFTIKGMVGILHDDHRTQLGTDGTELIDHISLATRRLEALVGSILSYSKLSLSTLSTEVIDLNELCAGIAAEWAPQLESSGAKLEISSNLPKIASDRVKLFQIISNLVDNAIKYRDPKRSLIISIKDESPGMARSCTLLVADNGRGIPPEKQETIFKPFQRAHPELEIEGSGIGLATVKKLTERLGGTVKLSSNPGVGTEFRLTFRREASN